MKIVVGLGNPGKEYDKTKHNVGWLFLDYLSNIYNFKIEKSSLDSKICETKIGDEKVIFVKPQTYMNLSGNAVQKIKSWYKVDNSDILIVFDDIDIPFGETRFKINGSGGTHNGMKNIVQILNTKDIARIKIGIGGLKNEKQDLADFVLERFSNSQLNDLELIFNDARVKFENFLDKSSN
jgi:PTH1 family peptidyl-tRNA hydrolase